MLRAPSVFISKCNSKRIPPGALPPRMGWGGRGGAASPELAQNQGLAQNQVRHIKASASPAITWAERWGWVSSEPQAGWQEGGVGVREAWGGGTWASLGRELYPQPAKACLLYHLARPSSEPRRAPYSPCGQSRHLGNGKGGQASACPPYGNLHTPHLPGPRECPSECLPQGKKGGMRDRGKGQVCSLLLRESARSKKV